LQSKSRSQIILTYRGGLGNIEEPVYFRRGGNLRNRRGAAATSRAQSGESYGGQGLGSALANSPMMHQGVVRSGIDDITARADKESAFKIVPKM
jgi:hypothetical protein